jgi:hypothetical protein
MGYRTTSLFVAALCLSGCASLTVPPPAPKPEAPVAAQRAPPPAVFAPEPQQSPLPAAPVPPPASPQPPAPPPSGAPKPKPPASATAQTPISPPKRVAPVVAAPPPAATPSPAAPPPATLDLASLEQRLRDTKAIGVFTKLSLKNQVDDLLADFRALYKRAKPPPGPEFRQRYDLLLLKVLTLLQDGDPPLATAISSSKEAIWSILSDPEKLAKI